MLTEKELKQQLREAKKLKKQLRAGTSERLILYRKIQDIKKQLNNINEVDKDKESVINEIVEIDKTLSELINLQVYTKEQLEKHLKNLKDKKRDKIC